VGSSDSKTGTVAIGLPANTELTAEPVDCKKVTSTQLLCMFQTIPGGRSLVFSVDAVIISGAALGPLGSKATVTSDEIKDVNPRNDSARITVTVLPDEVDLSVTVTPISGPAGATGTMTVTVSNAGPGQSSGAQVIIKPPKDVTFDMANLPAGCKETPTPPTTR
jgi:hypothetical protein